MTKRLVLLVAAVLAGLMSIGLQGYPSTVGAMMKTKVVFATTADAITLDPAFISSTHERILSLYPFDYLVTIGPDGRYGPALAESFRQLNPTTWEFKLRRGVKFHNGEPLTAATVKFTYTRVQNNPKNPNQGELVTFQDIQTVDDHTLRFVTTKFDAVFMLRILKQPIVPMGYIKEKGDDYFGEHPVGTGPYVFKEWVKNDHTTYEANPNYWGGSVPVKTVVFKPVPEYSTRAALLRTGEVDFIDDVLPDQAAALAKETGIKIHSGTTFRSYMVILRSDRAPLDSKELRQALNYATNKESIVKNIFRGYGVINDGQILTPGQIGYNPGLKPYPYDPARAKELLSKAGYPNGFQGTFMTPSGQFTLDKEMAEAIAAQLGRVGVRLKVQPVEYSVYTSMQMQSNFPELSMLAFGASFDGGEAYERAYVSGEPWLAGLYFKNPEVDSLLKASVNIVDPRERDAAVRRVGAIVREEAPLIFLHSLVKIYAARDGVPFKARPDLRVIFYPYPGNEEAFQR